MKRALWAAALLLVGLAALVWRTSPVDQAPRAAVRSTSPAQPERTSPESKPEEFVPDLPKIALPIPAEQLIREARAITLRSEALPSPFELLTPGATPKRAPGVDDWLAQHAERGQSLAEFRAQTATPRGRVIYLTTVGEFNATNRLVVDQLGNLMTAFFQLDVKWARPLPEAVASVGARAWELGPQLYTQTILDALEQRRPADAAALMAITQVDLYPDPSWNFVYGQARLAARVGVMSTARDGVSRTESGSLMRRSFASASHEVGHMFGLRHCIAWECALNGSNHRAEADARPLEPCPACLAKLQLSIGFDPEKRWRELAKRYATLGLDADARVVLAALRALSVEPQTQE